MVAVMEQIGDRLAVAATSLRENLEPGLSRKFDLRRDSPVGDVAAAENAVHFPLVERAESLFEHPAGIRTGDMNVAQKPDFKAHRAGRLFRGRACRSRSGRCKHKRTGNKISTVYHFAKPFPVNGNQRTMIIVPFLRTRSCTPASVTDKDMVKPSGN